MTQQESMELESLEGLIQGASGGELLLSLFLFLGIIGGSLLAIGWLADRREKVQAPPPTWGIEVVFLGFGLWLLMQMLGAFLGLTFLGDNSMPVPLGENPIALISGLLGGGIFSLIFAGILLKLPDWIGGGRDPLAISGSMISGLSTGAICFLLWIPGLVCSTILWAAGLTLMGFDLESQQQQVVKLFSSAVEDESSALLALLFLFAVGVAPVVEELLFRGLLYRWLAKHLGVGSGILISSLIFGAVHLEFSDDTIHLGAIGPVSILGAVSAWLLHRNGNLWACVGLHATFNLGQLMLLFSA